MTASFRTDQPAQFVAPCGGHVLRITREPPRPGGPKVTTRGPNGRQRPAQPSVGNGARSIARYGGYRYAPLEPRPAALRRGQVQMATEQFGPGPSVGNPAQAIGSPDADPVVDHQDPEFVVHRDVHLRPAGMSVTSGVAGLVGHDAVVAAYNAMSDNLGGEMTGGVLQPMVPARGVETIVGAFKTPPLARWSCSAWAASRLRSWETT